MPSFISELLAITMTRPLVSSNCWLWSILWGGQQWTAISMVRRWRQWTGQSCLPGGIIWCRRILCPWSKMWSILIPVSLFLKRLLSFTHVTFTRYYFSITFQFRPSLNPLLESCLNFLPYEILLNGLGEFTLRVIFYAAGWNHKTV